MKSKPFVGVWLDHREAHLFWADEQANVEAQYVQSEFQETGEPSERSHGNGPNGSQSGGVAHASLEHRRREQLNHYYKDLAKSLREADDIYVFGPGLAKKELAQVLAERVKLADRLRGVESADRMTKPQMAARVREFFGLPREGQ